MRGKKLRPTTDFQIASEQFEMACEIMSLDDESRVTEGVVGVLVGRRGEILDEALDHAVHEGREELIAGSDEVVDGRGGHLGSFGDLLDRDGVQILLTEEGEGGFQDGLSTPRLVSFAESRHGSHHRGSRIS